MLAREQKSTPIEAVNPNTATQTTEYISRSISTNQS